MEEKHAKLKRSKPYKKMEPFETVQRIRNILYEKDFFLIESGQKIDPVTGVCSCRVIIGDEGLRRLNIGSNGKGMNARYSLASAYAEFMERLGNGATLWKILGIPGSVPHAGQASEDELIQMACNLFENAFGDHEEAVLFAKKYADSAMNFKTVTFREYRSGESVSFPAALYNRMTGSNGMAAGNTITEAVLQGLSELFERAAIHRLFTEQITPPSINEECFADFEVSRRLNRLGKAGIHWRILDCSLGIGLPVIGLLLEKDDKYHVHFGADPSPVTALERCLTETFQGRDINSIPLYPLLKEYDNKRVLFENERREYTDSTGMVPVWLTEGDAAWKFRGFDHPVTVSDEDDIEYYLEILDKMGKKLYVADNSFCGFPTVRLYVPGITENHCPDPNNCIERELPGDIHKCILRLPCLSDQEHRELALRIKEWLYEAFGIKTAADFDMFSGEILDMRKVFPAGIFPVRKWDEKLLIAAVYLRGGLREEGTELLDKYISDQGVSDRDASIYRTRLNSRSLTFIPTEWPQCPDCSSCRAKHLCCRDKVEELQAKLSELLRF